MFEKLSESQIEKRRNIIIKIVKGCRNSMMVISNIAYVDFLEITSSLKAEFCQSLGKANSDTKNIDISSNHPSQTLKQLPKSIRKRLSEKLSSKEVTCFFL